MNPSKQKFYITSPIYYVNDIPHIGHVYTSLACDIIARHKRSNGFDVHFLTGTDEHGQKVAKSAQKNGITEQEFCDKISQKFKNIADFFHISYDDFIRTTDNKHKNAAKQFWKKLQQNGWIYKDTYEGWYSIKDEAFYQEDEIKDGFAPTGAEVVWEKQESYFFKLSHFQDILLKIYQENPDFISPTSRANETASFVRGGKEYIKNTLRDLSISRKSLNWGIKVPEDEEHSIYVWLDALVNYISALDYPNGKKYQKFWRDRKDKNIFHMVGKDIVRFHGVYWPTFLLAHEYRDTELAAFSDQKLQEIIKILPNKIFAHGWWTNEGKKISKSTGNVINPYDEIEWLQSLGIEKETAIDYFRYFLIKEVPFGQDGNYSRKNFMNVINADLANNIGNLLQRNLKFIQKNFSSQLTKTPKSDEFIKQIIQQWKGKNYDIDELYQKQHNITNCDFDKVLVEIINLASIINRYFDDGAPWQKIKDNQIIETQTILYITSEFLRIIAILLLPFIPYSANKILELLSIKPKNRTFLEIKNNPLANGHQFIDPKAIFPRITQ